MSQECACLDGVTTKQIPSGCEEFERGHFGKKLGQRKFSTRIAC
jgi:hypothetical protein